MKFRDLVEASYIPCRKVAYGVIGIGSIAFAVFTWLFILDVIAPSLYWIGYIAILLMFIGVCYLTFWVYRAGYKKRALLMGILYIAIFAISIIVLMWIFESYSAIKPLLPK